MEPYQELEREWAEANGLDPLNMVVCSSGTAALHLALEAMELPQGSQVIVPDLTMVACPRAVVLAGLEPVFVDCCDNLNAKPELVSEAVGIFGITQGAGAVMAVHVYGRQMDIGYLRRAYIRCPIIEDLAEAHGVKPHPQTDAACWSFFRNKIVAGEEGGAVWFREQKRADLAKQLRSLGFTEAHDFNHVPRGHNYRMSNPHAQLIRWSLSRMEANVEQRWEQWRRHTQYCPNEWMLPKPDAPWVFAFRVPDMKTERQNALVGRLNEADVKARHCFKPMSHQKEFLSCKVVGSGKAATLSQEVCYLPLSPELLANEVADRVWAIIEEVAS